MVRHQGPWKGLDSVEYATLEWVDWLNRRRLLEPIGYVPPTELEKEFYPQADLSEQEALKQASLHCIRGGLTPELGLKVLAPLRGCLMRSAPVNLQPPELIERPRMAPTHQRKRTD